MFSFLWWGVLLLFIVTFKLLMIKKKKKKILFKPTLHWNLTTSAYFELEKNAKLLMGPKTFNFSGITRCFDIFYGFQTVTV